jgi:hypothetical protein
LKDEIQKLTGAKLIEREISIHEIKSAFYESRLIEIFGGATSSQIKSFSKLVYKETTMDLEGDFKVAKLIS